jgi:hypothetical protein
MKEGSWNYHAYSYPRNNTFCQCPSLAGHGIQIFDSSWAEVLDIRRSSVWMVLALLLWSGLLKGPGAHNRPSKDLSAWGNYCPSHVTTIQYNKMWLQHEADHSPPSSVGMKNVCSHFLTHLFIVLCLLSTWTVDI